MNKLTNTLLRTHLDLKYYTSIRIAGTVEWAFFPNCKEALPEVFSMIQDKLKVEFFVLGKGSNVIIKEGPLHMAAIMTHHLENYQIDGDLVIADAGVPMSFLARESILEHKLAGLEFLYGLPGSLGGGIFMNARVYGSEFNDVVEWVEVYDYEKHQFLTLSREECEYSYKESIFQKKPYFIARAALRLQKASNPEESWKVAENNRKLRVDKKQFSYPSAGSFFKNNYELGRPSGQILDELNLKGLSQGGASVSDFHANFFINQSGHATYQDMKELMEIVEKKIQEKNGFTLETEVCFIPKLS